jgi:hypothetical protein
MNSRPAARLIAVAAVLTALLVPAVSGAQLPRPSLPDSLFLRAQRLLRDGDAARARALLDSLVRTSHDGTNARAQALLWRATLAIDSATVEGDYIAIVVDHALSPHAADALLRLGQIEYARGSRTAAVTHLERLVLEHRTSAAAADGWFWLGLSRIGNNDLPNGCVALDSARRRIPSSNVELLNRLDFVSQPCRALAEARPAGAQTAPPRDSAPAAERPTSRRWSAQVAAFRTNAEAERLVRSLKEKGHSARVDKLTPLFHVRIGAFATRAEAVTLVSRLKREKIDAIVVEATRREP